MCVDKPHPHLHVPGRLSLCLGNTGWTCFSPGHQQTVSRGINAADTGTKVSLGGISPHSYMHSILQKYTWTRKRSP